MEIDKRQHRRYVENVGHEPPDAPEEYAWQWRYRGRPAERELLADLLQQEAEETPPEQEETLF